MKKHIKNIINLFNHRKIEKEDYIESISLSSSDFEEKYRNECSKHAVTIEKLNGLTVVSSAKEKIIESYEIALDPERVEKTKINFEVDIDDKSNRWSVITGYCQLGGCNQEELIFNSEFEARRKAIELTLNGNKPKSTTSCPSCFSEYMNS
ncbi:hypothetical protein JSQ81_13995 [Sporosarcina sp. Marseille-Q4063]|uniref:hypothetical protein n=1 Tax=Sporosarcina sp. Marseille-Q4063 TaxID=2810514 RepID=UPI001BB0395E|nr:hypothetical protein [Sporosarcina sp. Marseille-Q4063]QUW20922.1 hypothetical protein JSQ81_13995 [Sporosarcina sp. Marseille-Q4063]